MAVIDEIRSKLTEALAPAWLDIVDDSQRHAGHAGARPEGETHFRIVVVSPAFEGKSRVERHRMVNQVLARELANRVHALSLQTLTPAEVEASKGAN